jgi:hypothetical protein
MENISSSMGTLITEGTAPAQARISIKESSDVADGWRIVFSGKVIHAPTVARGEDCGGIAEWLPQTEGCHLTLYKHEDGESSAFYF